MLDIVTQVNVTRRQCEIVRVHTRSPVVRRTGDVLGATGDVLGATGDPLPSNVQLWIRSFALEHRNTDFCSCF